MSEAKASNRALGWIAGRVPAGGERDDGLHVGVNLSRWTRVPSTGAILFRPTAGSWLTWAVGIGLIIAALVLATWIVYRTGGTAYAYPYLILLPVIAAAALYKIPGGLLAAFVAALALGPWMPLEVSTGQMQETGNWLVRMGMYLIIGGFTGILSTALYYRQQLAIIVERTDPASGLVAPNAVGHMLQADAPADIIGYEPDYGVVVAFEGGDNVVRAMGIDAGNVAIYRFARVLTETVGDDILVTRISGATFGILLARGDHGLSWLLERVRRHMPQAIEIDGVSILLLPRFGVARLTDEERARGQPFRKPFVALYLAKARAHTIARYSEAQDRETRANVALLADFRDDLEAGSIDVHFQPKLDLATRRIVGAEALVRWKSASRGAVSPGRFVPLVESTTLVDPMTRLVVDRAARTAAEWRAQGLDIEIAVNLSAYNLQNADFVAWLLTVPRAHGIPTAAIEIEITETALMRNLGAAQRALERLREAGFAIAMDDFGTGYSSLSYLKELSIDWVKLDQSFVRDLLDNPKSREIAAATAAMCKRLNYRLIAEGVESAAALEFLRDQNYDAIQGYYLAQPMPAAEFLDWLSRPHEAVAGPAMLPAKAV